MGEVENWPIGQLWCSHKIFLGGSSSFWGGGGGGGEMELLGGGGGGGEAGGGTFLSHTHPLQSHA